jgi:hypothetical protein
VTVEKTLADLNRTLGELIEVSREMGTVASVAERARRRLLTITIAVGALATLLLAAVLLVAVENRQTGDQIVSCTSPDGECFKRGQTRTAQVVQRILDGQIANTECRNEPDVRACVEAKLAS